jgi:hypothetical protein
MLDRPDLHGVGARVVEAELAAWRDLYAERCKKHPDADRILSLTKTYNSTVQMRTAAEQRLLDMRVREGLLVTEESSRAVIRDALLPVIRQVRDLASTMAVRVHPTNPDLARRELNDKSLHIMRLVQQAMKSGAPRVRKGGAAAPGPDKGASARSDVGSESGGAAAPVPPDGASVRDGVEGSAS